MIKNILRNEMFPFGFTLFLILMEALLTLLFPLFIGYALEDAMNGTYQGVFKLGGLGLVTLAVGVSRRLFDSRYYAKVYQKVGTEVMSRLKEQDTSTRSARLGMIKELIEFLEFSLPELINALITLIGVIIIVATLNINVFVGTLISAALIMLIYSMSSAKTLRFNKASNDEEERQVAIISQNDDSELKDHLKKVMKWNVKLSDLEAQNFSLAWFILIIFLVVSIIISVDGQIVKYGALFSLTMYVFQFMENVINLPFFYQNWLRLKEITNRLSTN